MNKWGRNTHQCLTMVLFIIPFIYLIKDAQGIFTFFLCIEKTPEIAKTFITEMRASALEHLAPLRGFEPLLVFPPKINNLLHYHVCHNGKYAVFKEETIRTLSWTVFNEVTLFPLTSAGMRPAASGPGVYSEVLSWNLSIWTGFLLRSIPETPTVAAALIK